MFRIMELGPDGASIRGTIPIPAYWPKNRRNLQVVNDEIFALQVKYRNPIVAKWVMGMRYPEMAKLLTCAYNTAKDRTEKAENILEANVMRRLKNGRESIQREVS